MVPETEAPPTGWIGVGGTDACWKFGELVKPPFRPTAPPPAREGRSSRRSVGTTCQ